MWAELALRVGAGRGQDGLGQRAGPGPSAGVGDLVPNDDHRQVAPAVAYQQFCAAAPPAQGIRWQQAAPDERCALAEQSQGGGAALFGGQVGRDLRPVSGVVFGQLVGHRATVGGGVGDPSLSGRIQGRAWCVGGRGVVLQMHPATAPGNHSRIEQHCRVHAVRLDRGTDSCVFSTLLDAIR